MPTEITSAFSHIPGLPQLSLAWALVKIIFILADLALLGFFGYSFYASWQMRPNLDVKAPSPSKPTRTLQKDVVQKRWQQILEKTAKGGTDALRLSIIETDTLVNDVLKWLDIPGEHMADRLQAFDSEEVKTLDRVWRAHRLRNDLVHTAGFFVTPEDAQRTLTDFESFLKEIGAL